MGILRFLLQTLGVLAALMGLLWIGQGLGIVNWPESSFMLGEREWVLKGAALALAGFAVFSVARRMR